MKKIGKILWVIFEIIIILYVIVATTIMLCTNKFGYNQFGEKTLLIVNDKTIDQLNQYKENDIVVIEEVKYDKLSKGDVIYYYDTLNEHYIVREGTIASKEGNNESALYYLEETGSSISNQRLVGIYSGTTISGFGMVVSILSSQIGFLLLVILPIFVLFLYQIYKIVMLLKYDDEKGE